MRITDIIIRFLDIIFSLLALILLLPIFIPIMIILKLTGEGEVFYFQNRIGKNEKYFKLIKFATMVKNSANIGTGEVTLANDSRLLPFGKFLRKTKINELAQLLNILKGDISVIGPRPQTKKYYFAFNEEDRHYISQIKPGLSGVGSIVFRDEEVILEQVENPVEFDLKIISPYKGQLETWYVKNKSVKLYFQLIMLTIIAVFMPENKLYKEWLYDLPQIPIELKDLV